jgi:hypothetical protein
MPDTDSNPHRPVHPVVPTMIMAGALLLAGVASETGWPARSANDLVVVGVPGGRPDLATTPPGGVSILPPVSAEAPLRLIVHPRRLELGPGVSQQMCLFFGFPDGKVGRRSSDVLIPQCDSSWREMWPDETRDLTLAQQVAIDGRCPTLWSASGGRISASGSYTPGGVPGGYSVVAISPDGPCRHAGGEVLGSLHRRWRVVHDASGDTRLIIDPNGEWNTMADLLAERLRPDGRPPPVQLAFSRR